MMLLKKKLGPRKLNLSSASCWPPPPPLFDLGITLISCLGRNFSSVTGGHITKQNLLSCLLHKGRGVLKSVMATLEDISLFSSFISFHCLWFSKAAKHHASGFVKGSHCHLFPDFTDNFYCMVPACWKLWCILVGKFYFSGWIQEARARRQA